MKQPTELDLWHMRQALRLAERGRGLVQPNPLVGCVVARGAEIIGEGWHRRYGGPHAEVEALAVAGPRAAGSTLYVTLEPCCHQGKTPPCTQAVLDAGIRRVVAAQLDPFPAVAGKGLAQLAAAGLEVQSGVLEAEARWLNAPYLRLVQQGRPWVTAKWAMTLDGKLAAPGGDSRWISSPEARARVHVLRGQMDAILIGRGTAVADDPLLTARPPGPRQPLRIVLDRQARLASTSQLVRTAREFPLLVAVGPGAAAAERRRLEAAGCEVWVGAEDSSGIAWLPLLEELGRRRLTHLLVEGGAAVLGSLFDQHLLDEVHVFVAPRLVGGGGATSPLAGQGLKAMAQAWPLADVRWETVGPDLYLQGRVQPPNAGSPPESTAE